ncbi:MAG: O-antigen ligase family protein [Thermodesulfobacteriota bacterium]|nr:O-antigen ligase family protein [Thermodesulfobacteriota bacterium]
MKQISGQTNIQLLFPLVILLLASLALAYMIPNLSGKQALALGGCIIFFVVCLISTETALYFLIFSMLLSPEFIVGSTGGASLGRGVTLRLDDFIILIIGFGWLVKMAVHKQLGLFLKTPLNKPIGYYIIACLTSTLLSAIFANVDLKTGLLFVLKYFEYMFIYFMVANHLRDKKQMRKYLWAMLATCIFVSVIGMFQIPEGGRVSAPFEGEMGEPNTFGGYLVFMVCIAMGLSLTAMTLRDHLMYGTIVILFAAPLLFTQSRSSYLAAIPALLAFVWLSDKKRRVIAVLILVGFLLPFVAPNPAKQRVAYTFTQGRDRSNVVEIFGVKLDTSTTARLSSMKNVAADWIRHPFFGFGVTGYKFVDAQYFRVLIETGIFGLVTFFILIYAIFRQAYHVCKKTAEPFEKGLCMGFIAGFVGLLVHSIGANTFIIVRIMEPFWFVLAMVIMLPNLRSEGTIETRSV